MAKQLLRPPLPIRAINSKPTSVELEILNAVDALQRWAEQASRVINNLVSNIPADSTASDVAGIVADFNALLAILRGLDVK